MNCIFYLNWKSLLCYKFPNHNSLKDKAIHQTHHFSLLYIDNVCNLKQQLKTNVNKVYTINSSLKI